VTEISVEIQKKKFLFYSISGYLSVPPSLFQRRYIILVYHRGLCLQLLISVCGFQWNFTGLLFKISRNGYLCDTIWMWNNNSGLHIRKKGYGVYIHNKKSLHALDKTQSKGTVLLLLFFISKSQWGLQHAANVHNSLQVQDRL
jgi:hypothetical protein